MPCPRCQSDAVTKDGSTPLGGQRFRCQNCRCRFTQRSSSAFSGCAFADRSWSPPSSSFAHARSTGAADSPASAATVPATAPALLVQSARRRAPSDGQGRRNALGTLAEESGRVEIQGRRAPARQRILPGNGHARLRAGPHRRAGALEPTRGATRIEQDLPRRTSARLTLAASVRASRRVLRGQ
jgi:InsA N-terminal domain